MEKKQPIVIELDDKIKEQEFLNWALDPEKDKSEGIQRARNLISRENRIKVKYPLIIKENGKTIMVKNNIAAEKSQKY